MSGRFNRRVFALLAVLIVAFTTIMAPMTAYAYEAMDTSRDGTSSLSLKLPAPSDSVKLYFVATMDAETNITMREEFADLGVNLENIDSSEEWAEKAETMSAQLIGSEIKPMVAETGEGNVAAFENLGFGIYLVVVDNCQEGNQKYTITPNFISVPNSTDGNTWIYDVSATLKYETVPTPTPGPDKVKFAVRKVWTNDGEGTPRPPEIKIQTMKRYAENEEWAVVEEVTLNTDNNWYYAWESEADGAEWTVKELTNVEHYSLDKIDVPTEPDESGVICFTLTNRYLTPTPTSTLTPTPSIRVTATPTPRNTATPTPRSYKATATPRPNVTTKITHTTPKTGDDQNILLPVIGVLAAGLVLVLLGLNMRKKSGKDE